MIDETGVSELGLYAAGEYFAALSIPLSCLAFALTVNYLPLRARLRTAPRNAAMLNLVLVALLVGVYCAFPSVLLDGRRVLICFMAFWWLGFVPLSLYLLRDCVFQNMFSLLSVTCGGVLIFGVKNWLEINLHNPPLVSVSYLIIVAIVLACCAAFLFLGTRMLEKLFSTGPDTYEAPVWNVVWIIPAVFCATAFFSTNFLTVDAQSSSTFLLTRILMIVALCACMWLMTGIARRERALLDSAARYRFLEQMDDVRNAYLVEVRDMRAQTDATIERLVGELESLMMLHEEKEHEQVGIRLEALLSIMNSDAKPERLCENETINALMSFYRASAHGKGIETRFQLAVPPLSGKTNIDVSRVIGNMVENAIEACERLEYGTPFISMTVANHGKNLIIVMDNSFDGEFACREGSYVSRKRESGVATGLDSIASIAQAYQGTAVFETEGRVFKSSVRLVIAPD